MAVCSVYGNSPIPEENCNTVDVDGMVFPSAWVFYRGVPVGAKL